jgi:hypothetical protein
VALTLRSSDFYSSPIVILLLYSLLKVLGQVNKVQLDRKEPHRSGILK